MPSISLLGGPITQHTSFPFSCGDTINPEDSGIALPITSNRKCKFSSNHFRRSPSACTRTRNSAFKPRFNYATLYIYVRRRNVGCCYGNDTRKAPRHRRRIRSGREGFFTVGTFLVSIRSNLYARSSPFSIPWFSVSGVRKVPGLRYSDRKTLNLPSLISSGGPPAQRSKRASCWFFVVMNSAGL